jgi:hypothetical protein
MLPIDAQDVDLRPQEELSDPALVWVLLAHTPVLHSMRVRYFTCYERKALVRPA